MKFYDIVVCKRCKAAVRVFNRLNWLFPDGTVHKNSKSMQGRNSKRADISGTPKVVFAASVTMANAVFHHGHILENRTDIQIHLRIIKPDTPVI